MGFVDPVRHCGSCSRVTKIEKEFFDERLKVLFNGAPFKVTASFRISQEASLYNLKLAQDERNLHFEPLEDEQEALNPLDLCRIISVEKSDGGDGGNLALTYKETATDETRLGLECPEEPSRKPSLAFIEALQEAMKFVFDSRNNCNQDENPNDQEDDE